jgi:hypothetical protein
MAKKGSGLTPKQQHFCRVVVSGCTMSDAYREAYSASKMKPATIHREATKLVSNPLITTRIEGLNRTKDRAVVASAVSDKELVLTELRWFVKEADTDSNKIRATEILGRTIPGLFKGEEPAAPERTAAEIETELSDYLAGISGNNVAKLDKRRT